MALATGEGQFNHRVKPMVYIVSSNKLKVAWHQLRLWLRGCDAKIYYTTEKDLDDVARFKIATITELGIVWFMEADPYQAAYISVRTACHVVVPY